MGGVYGWMDGWWINGWIDDVWMKSWNVCMDRCKRDGSIYGWLDIC